MALTPEDSTQRTSTYCYLAKAHVHQRLPRYNTFSVSQS